MAMNPMVESQSEKTNKKKHKKKKTNPIQFCNLNIDFGHYFLTHTTCQDILGMVIPPFIGTFIYTGKKSLKVPEIHLTKSWQPLGPLLKVKL